MIRPPGPARRRLMPVLLAAAATVALLVAFLVVRSAPDDVSPAAQGRLGPVLLVPGYGGSTTGLDAMARALRASGRDATVLQLPGDGTGDLNTDALALKSAVDAALSRTHADSVDVVGYSAGGVVARLWVRDDGGAGQARRVVTLGSPHHGTGLAAIALDLAPSLCPAACAQLAPGSELLRRLNAGDETPPGPLFVSIRSATDHVVPAESAVLDGATNILVQAVCPHLRVEHSELPDDPLVIAITKLELGSGRPAVPSSGQCRQLRS
jgi:pimeloyl-ACP methyl ester carboxylesterase